MSDMVDGNEVPDGIGGLKGKTERVYVLYKKGSDCRDPKPGSYIHNCAACPLDEGAINNLFLCPLDLT